MFRTIALLALWSFGFSAGGGCGPRAVQLNPDNRSQIPLTTTDDQKGNSPGNLKVLAQGFQSSIKSPFVAVIRDAETYAKLAGLDGNLPKLNAEFFKTSSVVAAFLGERNTGGFSVEINLDPTNTVRVLEQKPGKDMMVTQAITSPFKVVAVEGMVTSKVWLDLDEAWRRPMKAYLTTAGTFTMSGGIAGTSEEFTLKGEVAVLRVGELATFQIRLAGKGTAAHSLNDFTTGTVDRDGKIKINQFGAGTLVSPPNAGLQAEGMFDDRGKKLSLNLMSRVSMIADGYGGRGSIEAELAGSADKP